VKLTKENVCVFIESEAQLEEARKMLEKYGEKESAKEYAMELRFEDMNYPYLRTDVNLQEWFLSNRIPWHQTQITIQQLEEILKESNA